MSWNTNARTIPAAMLVVLLAAVTAAAPKIENPSFEADSFRNGVGYAHQNGGGITGWEFEGLGLGVNPVWADPNARSGPKTPFMDNGKVPDGKQVLFMQNMATITQDVGGFEPGQAYAVRYSETGRHSRGEGAGWAMLHVSVGSEVVVRPHEVKPVAPEHNMREPYRRVTSRPFTAPAAGKVQLAFRTTAGGGVTALIDDVEIVRFDPATMEPTDFMRAAARPGELLVRNPSFEVDHYTKSPGYAAENGGIAGWQYSGNAGVNPVFARTAGGSERQARPFHDNGRVPDGQAVALIQNEAVLAQEIGGFEAGKDYRVIYHENARQLSKEKGDRPAIEVRLGGRTIVSPHEIDPVDAPNKYGRPFNRVESAVFTAPRDGSFVLEIRGSKMTGVTALIDQVTVVEVQPGA